MKTATDFAELHEAHGTTHNGSVPAWMHDQRSAALKHFLELGLPTLRDEEWKYTNTRRISEATFGLPPGSTIAEIPEALHDYLIDGAANLVFIDGTFVESLSSPCANGAVVYGRLQDLPDEQAALLKSTAETYTIENSDAFTALNQAFAGPDAILVHAAADAQAESVVHIVHITSASAGSSITAPRLLVRAERHAEVTVVESHLSTSDANYFCNALTDLYLAEGAHVTYALAQAQGAGANHVSTARVWQERNSRLSAFSMERGAALARHNLNIVVDGEGVESTLDGVYVLGGEQHIDNHTSVDHREPNCNSSQLYKGILGDGSRGVFNGKIFVQQKAQKTNAYQLNRNLLLGEKAKIDTKPQLEIFADDVRCTHGATVGQLEAEQIFYMQSRGIPREVAIRELSRGFAAEVVDAVPHADVRDLLMRHLAAYFTDTLD